MTKYIKTGWTIFLLSIVCAFPALGQDEEPPAFFQALNDVPLMAGLEELIDEAVMFDKAEGRIVESSAVTDREAIQTIEAFYNKTLPQLGWQETSKNHFVRYDEVLQMSFDKQDQYNIVHFMVSPR